jgi:Zn-dependent protease
VTFSFLRFPIRVRMTFLLVALVLSLRGSGQPGPQLLLSVLLVFIAILGHELGHALVARSFGYTADIDITGFGGFTRYAMVAGKKTRWRRVLISAAGPGAGLLLFAMGRAFLSRYLDTSGDGLFAWVTLYWSLLNLLPLIPLDGGHIVAEALDIRNRPWAGVTVGLISIGGWVALGALMWRLGAGRGDPAAIWNGLICLQLMMASVPLVRHSWYEMEMARARRAVKGRSGLRESGADAAASVPAAVPAEPPRDVQWLREAQEAETLILQGRDAEGAAALHALMRWVPASVEPKRALDLLLLALLAESRVDDAETCLLQWPGTVEISRLNRAALFLLAGQPERAIELARDVSTDSETAHARHIEVSALVRLHRLDEAVSLASDSNRALCPRALGDIAGGFAQLHRDDEALRWLRAAAERGVDRAALETEALRPLLETPGGSEIAARARAIAPTPAPVSATPALPPLPEFSWPEVLPVLTWAEVVAPGETRTLLTAGSLARATVTRAEKMGRWLVVAQPGEAREATVVAIRRSRRFGPDELALEVTGLHRCGLTRSGPDGEWGRVARLQGPDLSSGLQLTPA